MAIEVSDMITVVGLAFGIRIMNRDHDLRISNGNGNSKSSPLILDSISIKANI